MTREQQNDDDQTYHDAIDTKGLKAISSQEIDKPLHRQQCHHEGNDTTQNEHRNIMASGPSRIFLHQIKQVEQRGSCHRRYSQEERELGSTTARKSLSHTSHDGGHRARHTRNRDQS